jgi:hypothetical protein
MISCDVFKSKLTKYVIFSELCHFPENGPYQTILNKARFAEEKIIFQKLKIAIKISSVG